MVTHASGVSNVLAMTRFLDEVIHEPLRMEVLVWPVAFECMILYLRMVEAHGSAMTLVFNWASSRAWWHSAITSQRTYRVTVSKAAYGRVEQQRTMVLGECSSQAVTAEVLPKPTRYDQEGSL
jgi:hypothetical protein